MTDDEFLWALARHMYNVDEIPLHKWALKGSHLLTKLERKYPDKYAAEVLTKSDPNVPHD